MLAKLDKPSQDLPVLHNRMHKTHNSVFGFWFDRSVIEQISLLGYYEKHAYFCPIFYTAKVRQPFKRFL